ncbi:glycosyltransferase family 4 protein [Enterococcus ratti]|uniref:glycosyltransferase family 4 protein n=1 Tax=Enterococcus ratti TaxID=150033 RepID=UPI003513BDBE
MLYVTTISNTLNAFLIPHIDQLIKTGHEVSVACAVEQPLAPYFYEQNIPVFQVPFSRRPLTKDNLLAYKKIKKVVEDNHIEVIHTHTPIASMVTRLACKKMAVKIYYTAHGFHFYKGAPLFNWLTYYPIEKYLSKYTNKMITINHEDYFLALQKFASEKTYLINGVGIPVETYENIQVEEKLKKNELGVCQSNTKILLSVGELNKNKNHEQVIEVLKDFKDQNFQYFICGTGPLKQALKQKIKKLGLEEKIKLLGYRKDIIEMMKISDLFIFPSLREGLPVSIMEAMSVGVPVVASNIRGNKDLIFDGVTGKLFDVNQSKELHKIFCTFFSGELPLMKYSHGASDNIQHFSERVVIKQIVEIYET